jgi:hypothetical protein
MIQRFIPMACRNFFQLEQMMELALSYAAVESIYDILTRITSAAEPILILCESDTGMYE